MTDYLYYNTGNNGNASFRIRRNGDYKKITFLKHPQNQVNEKMSHVICKRVPSRI